MYFKPNRKNPDFFLFLPLLSELKICYLIDEIEKTCILFFSAKDEFADGDVPSPKLKRQAFTLEFKLQVMEAAKNSSNREQARLHNIHESVIRRWRKQISEEQIKEAVKDPNKMTLRLKPFTI